MKEVKINDDENYGGTHFFDIEAGKPLVCAYKDRPCYPYCTACEINEESLMTTATCLRGSFTFAEIK